MASSTWNSIKDATYDNRASFRAGVKSMGDSIDETIDRWSDKASTIPEKSRDAWNAGIEKLREARAELAEKTDNLQNATADTWEGAKEGVRKAWDRVQEAYRDLENQLSH
ncbi:MAG TPA: hypothetical protein VGA56_19585 [Opitutaceae bacterium]